MDGRFMKSSIIRSRALIAFASLAAIAILSACGDQDSDEVRDSGPSDTPTDYVSIDVVEKECDDSRSLPAPGDLEPHAPTTVCVTN